MNRKEFVLDAISRKQELVVEVSDRIFDFAETGFHEFETAKLYQQVLEKEGFAVEMGIAGMPTAFKASYGSGKPVVGFLAEYDALPELSQLGGCTERKPACGENPDGHGCGHNLLGAGTLAAALAVKAYLEENPGKGTVVLFGCPSEEKGNGKTIMARDGIFDGVDAALTWHPDTANAVWTTSSLANVSVFFNFKGVTSHAAAAPELGRSALDAAELMSVGVNYLREHIISDARIHYAYRDVGGIAPNVVQGHSRVHYFIRAPKSWQVQEIYKRVIDVAEGAAKMTGTEMTYELYAGLSDFIPNHALSEVLYESLEEVGGPEFDEEDFALARRFFTETATEDELEAKKAAVKKKYGQEAEAFMERPLNTRIEPLVWAGRVLPGSTDVGDVQHIVPCVQVMTATCNLAAPGHSWQITACAGMSIGMKGMLYGAKVMAATAMKLVDDPKLVEEAKEEFKKQMNGKTYKCPVTEEIVVPAPVQ